MDIRAEEIKTLARSILEDKGSPMLLNRVENVIEDAGGSRTELERAIKRVAKMVKLFVGADEANLILERATSILEKEP